MKRSFGIDVVRVIAIAMVIFRHYGFYKEFNWGYFAVETLFIVSGYMIGQMLFNGYLATPVVQPYALKRFMIRRWLRVFPLYYFVLVVKFILAPAIGLNIIWYFLFLQNHFYGVSFFPVSWTMGIEEWFYIVTPLMVYVFMRYISSTPKYIFLMLLGVIIFINLARLGWVMYSDRPWGGLTGNIPLRLDTPLIGVLLAFVKLKYREIFVKLNTLPVFLLGLGALAALAISVYLIRVPVDRMDEHLWTRTLFFPWMAVAGALMMPYVEQSVPAFKNPKLGFLNTIVVWGGKLTFPLYLAHADVHVYLEKFLHAYLPDLAIDWLAIFCTIGVSLLLHKYIEKQVLDWRDRRHPDDWQSKI